VKKELSHLQHASRYEKKMKKTTTKNTTLTEQFQISIEKS
jgi:hypothetical protein